MAWIWNGEGLTRFAQGLLNVVPLQVAVGAKSIEGKAKSLVPVVSGSLRSTIDSEQLSADPEHTQWMVNAGNTSGGRIGSDGSHVEGSPVDYAADIEYNHTPYMTPAAEQGFLDMQAAMASAIAGLR